MAAGGGQHYGSLSYTAIMQLGEAYARPGFGTFGGFDFSASFIAGSAIVTQAEVQSCTCP